MLTNQMLHSQKVFYTVTVTVKGVAYMACDRVKNPFLRPAQLMLMGSRKPAINTKSIAASACWPMPASLPAEFDSGRRPLKASFSVPMQS